MLNCTKIGHALRKVYNSMIPRALSLLMRPGAVLPPSGKREKTGHYGKLGYNYKRDSQLQRVQSRVSPD